MRVMQDDLVPLLAALELEQIRIERPARERSSGREFPDQLQRGPASVDDRDVRCLRTIGAPDDAKQTGIGRASCRERVFVGV